MKILKFCIPLFGFLFLVNAPLKAQGKVPYVNVGMTDISVGSGAAADGYKTVSVTVSSTTHCKLAVAIYGFGPGSGAPITSRSLNNTSTSHTFDIILPVSLGIIEARCGYMDDSDNYLETDGGCTVVIEPGLSYP